MIKRLLKDAEEAKEQKKKFEELKAEHTRRE